MISVIAILLSVLMPLAYGEETVAIPTLTVSSTPNASVESIPQGAQRVPFLTLRLKASCDAPIAVSSLTLRHAGRGNATDILRAYASMGGTRLSRAVSVPARNPFTLRLRSVVVPACDEASIIVLADLSSSAQASGEHRFDVLSVGTQSGVAVQTSSSSSSSPAALRVTPHATAPDVTSAFRSVLTSKEYGTARVVARFLLKGGKASNQNVLSITFTNDGSARNGDLQRLYLESSSQQRLSVPLAQMEGDTARITLTPPLLLRRNQSVLLQLRADVRASRTRTIDFIIEEPSDIGLEEAGRR